MKMNFGLRKGENVFGGNLLSVRDLPTELLREKSIEIKPRPADMMRMPNFDYDSIVVTTIKLQRKK